MDVRMFLYRRSISVWLGIGEWPLVNVPRRFRRLQEHTLSSYSLAFRSRPFLLLRRAGRSMDHSSTSQSQNASLQTRPNPIAQWRVLGQYPTRVGGSSRWF